MDLTFISHAMRRLENLIKLFYFQQKNLRGIPVNRKVIVISYSQKYSLVKTFIS